MVYYLLHHVYVCIYMNLMRKNPIYTCTCLASHQRRNKTLIICISYFLRVPCQCMDSITINPLVLTVEKPTVTNLEKSTGQVKGL